MLMEIDIRYPDFEEEYWNKRDHEQFIAEAKKANELEKKLDEVKSTNVKLISKCTKLEYENYEFRTENYCLKNKLNDLKIIHKDLEKSYLKDTDNLKTENKNLQSKYDSLCNTLEQKYWEAQRTIDKYAAENEDLKKSKKDLTRWREMYYDLQKERDELENKLLDTEDKLEETERELKGTKRYMEGYQNLYIEEVLKHKESDDGDEEKTLDIYDLEDDDGEDDDNKS